MCECVVGQDQGHLNLNLMFVVNLLILKTFAKKKVMTIRKKSEIFHLNYSSGLEGLPKGYRDYLFNKKRGYCLAER